MEKEIETILHQLLETFKEKNADYGNSFEKVRTKYNKYFPVILIRLSDKFERISSLLLKQSTQKVSDESVEDTLLDLANYAIMEVALRRLEKGE